MIFKISLFMRWNNSLCISLMMIMLEYFLKNKCEYIDIFNSALYNMKKMVTQYLPSGVICQLLDIDTNWGCLCQFKIFPPGIPIRPTPYFSTANFPLRIRKLRTFWTFLKRMPDSITTVVKSSYAKGWRPWNQILSESRDAISQW